MTIDAGSPEVKISEAIQYDADCTSADLFNVYSPTTGVQIMTQDVLKQPQLYACRTINYNRRDYLIVNIVIK